MRKIQFQTGYYCHIYNRGVDKRDIFCDEKDYIRFIRSMREFNRISPVGSLHMLKKWRDKKPDSLAKESGFFIQNIAYYLRR